MVSGIMTFVEDLEVETFVKFAVKHEKRLHQHENDEVIYENLLDRHLQRVNPYDLFSRSSYDCTQRV